tara:strand:+ start:39 stop:230 length:192 start_codon:yes stop_codon:yes gene_type:complete
MTLIDMIQTNANARKIVDELNLAELMSAFNITLTQARQIKHVNALLTMKESEEQIEPAEWALL